MGEPKSTQLAVRQVFKNDASLQRNLKKKKLIRNVSLPIGREKFIVTVGRLLFWKNIAAEEAVPKERAVLSANTSGCTRPAAARAPGCSRRRQLSRCPAGRGSRPRSPSQSTFCPTSSVLLGKKVGGTAGNAQSAAKHSTLEKHDVLCE